MNNRNIDKMIPIAMSIINSKDAGLLDDQKKIDSKYFGYINSMGATVIQSGMKQTLIFYKAEKENADRDKIYRLLQAVLKNAGILPVEVNDLYEYTEQKFNGSRIEYNLWQSHINEAIIACKLSIRTFSKKKDN